MTTKEKANFFHRNKLLWNLVQTKNWKYRLEHGCEICGELHPYCLQWHHKDPKRGNPKSPEYIPTPFYSSGPPYNHGKNTDVHSLDNTLPHFRLLCANCHRKVHFALRYNLPEDIAFMYNNIEHKKIAAPNMKETEISSVPANEILLQEAFGFIYKLKICAEKGGIDNIPRCMTCEKYTYTPVDQDTYKSRYREGCRKEPCWREKGKKFTVVDLNNIRIIEDHRHTGEGKHYFWRVCEEELERIFSKLIKNL